MTAYEMRISDWSSDVCSSDLFFLTAGFLGMLYYYLPKRAGRPIYSYRMSIIGFWGITFFYMWAGSHHLHYTALPQWVQTLGMTFSVMLLVPSWIAAANALLRSEERRVGNECVSTCRSRWSP